MKMDLEVTDQLLGSLPVITPLFQINLFVIEAI